MGLMHLLFGTKPDPKPEPKLVPLTVIRSDAPLIRAAPRPDLFDFTPIDLETYDGITDYRVPIAMDQTHGMLWVLSAIKAHEGPDGETFHPLVAAVPGHGFWMMGQPVPVDLFYVLLAHKHTYRIIA